MSRTQEIQSTMASAQGTAHKRARTEDEGAEEKGHTDEDS